MQKILVTGGAGFIGSHLVDRFIRDGREVIVVDDFSRGTWKNLENARQSGRLDVIEADICSLTKADLPCENIAKIVHLAALGRVRWSYDNEQETHRVNVGGTINVLQLARQIGIHQLIFASSSSVYGDAKLLPMREEQRPSPMSPYAVQKLEGEQLVRDFFRETGISTVSLRLFSVFGERQNPGGEHIQFIPVSLRAIFSGETPTVYGRGLQSRDFTYVADVVEGINLAMNARKRFHGQVFNLGTGVSRRIIDVVRMIENRFSRKIDWKFLPEIEEPKQTHASLERSAVELAYAPEWEFENSLARTIEYYRAYFQ